MNLRTNTVAGIIFFLAGLMFVFPITTFDVEYDGINNDRMDWNCALPITGLNAPDVDIDGIRADLTTLEEGEKLSSRHPDCKKLARAQFVLGIIAVLCGAFMTRKWWRETSDLRAEKRFRKLQDYGAGKKKSILG